MSNIMVLTTDFTEAPWELVQNELHELETSKGAADPDPKFVGFDGESVFAKHLLDTNGNPLRLLMQVTWTAIDQSLQFRQKSREFKPDITVLAVKVVGDDDVVYLLDEPNDAPDPDYTWQGEAAADHDYLGEEALQEAAYQLFHEV